MLFFIKTSEEYRYNVAMYKLIISTFLMFFFSTVWVQANNKSYSFAGIDTGISHYDGTSAPSFGIKYGKQAEMLRTTIEFSYAQMDSNKLQMLLMEVDRGILSSFFKDSKFKPYVGLNYGFMQHNSNDKGYAYGFTGGVTYILDHSIDINLATRILKTSKIKNIKDINTINLSLHYFY